MHIGVGCYNLDKKNTFQLRAGRIVNKWPALCAEMDPVLGMVTLRQSWPPAVAIETLVSKKRVTFSKLSSQSGWPIRIE